MVSRTFSSSKSWVSTLTIWGTCILLLVLLPSEIQSTTMPLAGKIALTTFLLAVAGLLLWTWFATYYRISGEVLHYRCGPLYGTIPIQRIRKIKQNKYLLVGLRPALGLNGLVIHYNRWDEIYLSPADQEGFLRTLQEINSGIVVEE
jgi:hypothetical protein